jgi:alkanesulfonate monooxygenase SsuD/methylene tetrahydromethanopterin reductase-like flavin-dependent oxidoreductase (luciferase family)
MVLIGGTGEKYLLRTVAKYGDACNLFGSPETVKMKLDILRKHCEAVGRNYDSILKTKLTRVLISEDESVVKAALDRIPQGVPVGEMMIYGTPEQVTKQVEEFRKVGVDYLIVSASGPRENESLKLFGEKVISKFAE